MFNPAEDIVSILTSDSIPENTFFTFYIIASNKLGSSRTTIKDTCKSILNNVDNVGLISNFTDSTDIRDVRVVALKDNTQTILVTCDFIRGSDAQGCMVILVGELDNITVNLTRENLHTTGTINLTHLLSCYYEIIGFDIESNGSVGTLAVPGVITRNFTSGVCSSNAIKHPPRKFKILS